MRPENAIERRIILETRNNTFKIFFIYFNYMRVCGI